MGHASRLTEHAPSGDRGVADGIGRGNEDQEGYDTRSYASTHLRNAANPDGGHGAG